MRAVVVVGTITLDTIERAGAVHRDVPGGSALYAAAAASRVLPVHLLGVVGTDFPAGTFATLRAGGVDHSAVEVLEGPTFRWHARYDTAGDQRTTVSRDRGVAEGRWPRVVVPPSPFALVLGSMDPRAQRHVLEACAGASPVGLDSMAYWWTERGDDLRAMLPRVHVLFVDEEELAIATGTRDAGTGAAALHALGPEVVVVKRGSRGAWMQRRGEAALECGAFPLPTAVDPTGAGDAFAGAWIAALASEGRAKDGTTLRLATAIASGAVASTGIDALVRTTPGEARARARALAPTPAPPR